jgi:hypothetical protein
MEIHFHWSKRCDCIGGHCSHLCLFVCQLRAPLHCDRTKSKHARPSSSSEHAQSRCPLLLTQPLKLVPFYPAVSVADCGHQPTKQPNRTCWGLTIPQSASMPILKRLFWASVSSGCRQRLKTMLWSIHVEQSQQNAIYPLHTTRVLISSLTFTWILFHCRMFTSRSRCLCILAYLDWSCWRPRLRHLANSNWCMLSLRVTGGLVVVLRRVVIPSNMKELLYCRCSMLVKEHFRTLQCKL